MTSPAIVPPGEAGELYARSGMLMAGYWRDPVNTRKVLPDGWYATGDLAQQEPDGYLRIVGRVSDMIISGGFNVMPVEVESVIAAHPAVREVAVYAAPDPVWGESVEAAVVVRSGAQVTADELIELCRERLASFKKPRRIVFVGTIPRTSVGKVDKRALRSAGGRVGCRRTGAQWVADKDDRSGAPLAGRTAIVTGGSRGIGRAISVALARDGAAVAVNYRRGSAAAEQLAAELTAAAHAARAFPASLDSNAQIDDMVAAVTAEFGPPDIVVNCAGVASRGQPVADTDPAELARLMAVNAFGPHRLAQLVLPGMRKRGLGHIVMISSTATRVMGANGAPYNMAKAAMEALAYTLAAEEERYGDPGQRRGAGTRGYGDGTANDPRRPWRGGHVGTRRCIPRSAGCAGRRMSPAWSPSCVGPAAGYVTGQRIAVDGGAERSNRVAAPRARPGN